MDKVVYFNTLIEPKGGILSVIVIMIGILVLIIVPLMFVTVSIMKNTTLSLTENELVIKSMFYGRKIPLENIRIDGIKQINLEKDKEYNFSMRTNGISMPKFRSGWMRLKNGEKALAFVTDKTNIVLIPTNEYQILFSMDNIDEFIAKIISLKK